MGLFDKAKNLYSLQKQSKLVKEQLKNTNVESEVEGVTVVINGEFEVISIDVSDDSWKEIISSPQGKQHLIERLKKACAKATKKVQEIAGGKMKELWKQMG